MGNNKLKFYILILLAIVWGSSFILIKKGLLGLSPYELGALRILFAGTFILLIGFKSLSKIALRQWRFLFVTAMLGTFVPVFLFAVAQTEISSTISAILNSLTPLNTLWIGILFFAIDFQRRQIFGVFIGFLGSLLLVLNGAYVNPDQNYYYAILLIIASFCYATNVNFLNKYLSDLSPMSITAGSFAILYVPSLIVLYFSGFWQHEQQAEVIEALPYVALLGIVGTGIANVLFFKLLQISSPIFASSVTYLIPVVAFLWGLIDNESLTLIQLLGAIIVMFGVYLSARKK